MPIGDAQASHDEAGVELVSVTMGLDPQLLDLLRAYAEREGISTGEAVEDALLAWFGRDSSFGRDGSTRMPRFRREHDCY